VNNVKKAPVLTLENIAPYLPYGLKVVSKINNYSYTLLGACKDEILIQDDLNGWYATNIFKPILRPLSDLTKEIEHNGRTFVPMDTVGDIPNNFCKCDFVTDWCDKGGDFNEYVKEFVNGVFGNHHLDYLPFGFVQKLIEWHFDVFGLLDQNLAIDINSIEGKENPNAS
jgi:hypothetical protein